MDRHDILILGIAALAITALILCCLIIQEKRHAPDIRVKEVSADEKIEALLARVFAASRGIV
jgi:hypothetical protein